MSYTYKGKKPGWGYEAPPKSPTKRPEAVCGTNSGYYRHYRLREAACGPCKAAHAAANRPVKTRRELKPCGTAAAYVRHVRAEEIPDEACLAAHAEYMRGYNKRKKAA